MMVERATKAPEYFLVAVDRQTGKIAGILNGLATDETTFRDEFFYKRRASCPGRKNSHASWTGSSSGISGRGACQSAYVSVSLQNGAKEKDMVLLTCLDSRVPMYEKMGFQSEGTARNAAKKKRKVL